MYGVLVGRASPISDVVLTEPIYQYELKITKKFMDGRFSEYIRVDFSLVFGGVGVKYNLQLPMPEDWEKDIMDLKMKIQEYVEQTYCILK